MAEISLNNKVAIVTGSGRGIGRGVALLFAKEGARVVVNDLGGSLVGDGASQSPADEVVAEIKQAGSEAVANYDSVATIEGAGSIIKTAMDNFGRVDILVNNAGIAAARKPLIDVTEQEWDLMMNVNLKSQFMLGQMAARVMKEKGGGSIVNISSVAGIKPRVGAIYGITKAAVIMLTKAMAKEWGRYNIRVNSIAPGGIKTRLSERGWKDPDVAEMVAKETALLRWGGPEDIAYTALFLASDVTPHITGETIVVDGGEMVGSPPQFSS